MDSPIRPLRLAESVLRGEASAAGGGRPASRAMLGLLVLGFGMSYGGVMGTYGGLAGDRPWQLAYSAIKVPFLIATTFALSLPSFYVVNTLLGLRDDFPGVLRALLTTQAGLTVILTSLAPLTAFWYASGSAYQAAILFNGLMFAVASLGAQWLLRREYAPLIRKDAKHRWLLRAWIVIYVFVGVQMGWVLRPFIGDPRAPVQFFREDSWSNAYEVVLRMAWDVLAGRGR
ncbi:hypothetical protein OJF2_33470 [Aquisphaera giovannonii]|uniref:Uncharacterized protein n=1 Tax=Aquisphaera giovannonii TaxID=406548 RepID=A0A5B9W3J0_9BACT|nr:hypothetical protein [Aquisphaera giovannonii]QEH34804.1 hypothetical protein OJF2_33470 [Aquisphaera giovannonii]